MVRNAPASEPEPGSVRQYDAIFSIVVSCGSHCCALLVVAERVDHPRAHVVDGQKRRGRHAAAREFFEDQRRVVARQARAAVLFAHIDAAEAEARELLQHAAVEPLFLPARRVGAELVLRELRARFRRSVFGLRSSRRAFGSSAGAYSAALEQRESVPSGNRFPTGFVTDPKENRMLKTLVAAIALLGLAACGNAEKAGENADSAIEEATQGRRKSRRRPARARRRSR